MYLYIFLFIKFQNTYKGLVSYIALLQKKKKYWLNKRKSKTVNKVINIVRHPNMYGELKNDDILNSQ